MARDISRKRNEIGSSNKTAPKVDDATIQSAINQVYTELNELYKSVNKKPIGAANTPSDGKEGDIRLFQKTAADGSIGYFVGGKFGDSWASGRLGLDLLDPQLPEASQVAVSYVADGGSYITKDGVTFENLNENGDVGGSGTQVAVGNHNHASYEAHIADTTIHFTLADIPTTATVSNAASQGGASTAARSDHVHKLNTTVPYTWEAKQTITVSSGTVGLEVNGDVEIVGDLTVDYAATGDGNGNANIDGNVVLNQADANSEFTDSKTTTINGPLTANNNTIIKHPGGNQLSLKYDNTNKLDISVGSSGTSTLTSNAGLVFNANGIDPETTLTTDLGSSSKKWLSIYAGELVVENLVAQDVMATIGGRIMVAPTSELTQDTAISNVNSNPVTGGFFIKHAGFAEVNDILFLQSVDGTTAQVEAVKVINGPAGTGPYQYICQRNIDGSGPTVGGNLWKEGAAIVNLGHNQGDGFIDITSTSGIYSSSGPHIAIHARGSSDSGWNIPEVVRLGNLNGAAGYSVNKYGLVVGENITSSEENETTPFRGMKATDEGIGVFNTAITHQKGSSKKFFVGSDPRTGYDNEVVFALGDGITWNNNAIQNADLVWQKGTSGNYGLTLSNADLNLQITEGDILGALDWATNDNTPDNSGFYVTPNYLGFYDNGWKAKLGSKTTVGNNGGPSGIAAYLALTGNNSSLVFDPNAQDEQGAPEPALQLTNANISIDNISDVDIFLGAGIRNQGANSQDDIIIGSWLNQTNSASGDSSDRQGILIKHGAHDFTTLNHKGLRRRGQLVYPNVVGIIPEIAGWATSGAGAGGSNQVAWSAPYNESVSTTINNQWSNVTYNANKTFGPKANKIFDNPFVEINYSGLVPGRALYFQINPIGISWPTWKRLDQQNNYSIIGARKTNTEQNGTSHFDTMFIYRLGDNEQVGEVNAYGYQDNTQCDFPQHGSNAGPSLVGHYANQTNGFETYGPFGNYITFSQINTSLGGSEANPVSKAQTVEWLNDVRICAMYGRQDNAVDNIKKRYNPHYSSITVFEVDEENVPTKSIFSVAEGPIYQSSIGAIQNPF